MVTFFNQPWLEAEFKRGMHIVLSGKVDLFLGRPAMTHPEWEPLEKERLHTGGIVPVYPLTRDLSMRTMRRAIRQVVNKWGRALPDYLPEHVLRRTGLPRLSYAIETVHFPPSWDALDLARRRIAFDELLLIQLAMLSRRHLWQSVPANPLTVDDEWVEEYLRALPYELTGAQRRALAEIRTDMSGRVPMNRLMQGDVGSGKTVVAAIAIAIAVANGAQAALMAPTSILAEQHYRTISGLLSLAPNSDQIEVRLLTGATSELERADIYSRLADGSLPVIVGTHALIQERVEFANLGLAVIDEQHRFGVMQRGALRGKGTNPHLLVMTATPIPRTLALTVHADLDLTVIDEMPPGRIPVETRLIFPKERERAYRFIEHEVSKGHQAFIVYPLVEAEDEADAEMAAVNEYRRLQAEVFPELRLGLLHGRMSADEKDRIMAAMSRGEIDILISTSVIEVGIDVPGATVIMINGAERFGLAQLHQLRGRVGRGNMPSYCLLLATTDSEDALERLRAVESTTDGFKLAELDWQMRGPGDLLGVQQSGFGALKMPEMMDSRLVSLVQKEARAIYAEDPGLDLPEHALLARRVGELVSESGDVS